MSRKPTKRSQVTQAAPEAKRTELAPGLLNFIEFLTGTGEASLEAALSLPEREELRLAVQRLGPRARSLIGIIEKSGLPEDVQENALRDLWGALGWAFVIGSRGTISENTEVAIKDMRAGIMREAKDRRRQEDPANQIIREAAGRHHVGSKNRLYKVADVVVSEAQPLLEKQGHRLSDKVVLKRVVRLLEKTRS